MDETALCIVVEYDDCGDAYEHYGPGTRLEAANLIRRLADEHCANDNKDGESSCVNDDEFRWLLDGPDDMFSLEDNWSWQIVELTPFE